MSGNRSNSLSEPRRLVVKVGSAVVARDSGLDPAAIARVADQIAAQVKGSRQIVLVSSGAVACGFAQLGHSEMPRGIVDRQAAAAIGQQRMMSAYAKAFAKHGVHVAQVLLTSDDLEHRGRFLNARHTIDRLLRAGVVPIVNENDSMSFDEIKVGDNDRLSALVATLIDADLLVMLSVAPGVCDGGPGGAVIPSFENPSDALSHVGDESSSTGIGGMKTKVEAATIAGGAGITTFVVSGDKPDALGRAIHGESIGTRFEAGEGGATLRKRWIAFSAKAKGTIEVDQGAKRAIVERGASLLPKGIVGVRGSFAIGEPVEIVCGSVFARGLASYSSDEIERIKGVSSDGIEEVLGYAYADEVVHRDDLVLIGDSNA